MYGGAGKLGRGGGGGRGGGLGKRNTHSTFHAPSIQRSSTAHGGRLSVGGGSAGPRNRTSTSSAPTNSAPSGQEETFSLVTGNPLNFAMIIRLAPDLVEEIKRVEAQGGTARIKFDANANNTSGNVIGVGGKDFRFTWSREMGDLCDTYEERQSGEDRNGLLVESGCAWRKLNVQRILDESTKNHVKMRSEEAERKLKSRKAIVLDHGNPSVKSQTRELAAAEVNPRRMHFNQKKEPPFKKRKVEPPPGPPPKPAYKPGLSATTPSKGRLSASPVPSPLEQSGASASPSGTGNHFKGHVSVEDVIPPQAMSKKNTPGPEKDVPSGLISGAVRDKPGSKGNLGGKPADLQSMLISLLMENPKGMSLKALEKAIGDTIPNSVRQIEHIIKKIATFQAPGRYFLKQGVDLESFKKPSSESGSSPEDNHHQTPALDDNYNQISAREPTFSVRAPIDELEEHAQFNSKPVEESNALEKIEASHHSPDLSREKKVSDNTGAPVGSSSNSGSDSDSESESSDTGSDSRSRSRSRSKSRSPVGSGSGNSSDSESDVSSNSKQGSDEDVDIMTSDDDKEPKHKLQASKPGLSTSPIPWRNPDGGPVHNRIDEKQDGHSSDIVEIEKDFPDDDQEAEMAVVTNSVPDKEVHKPVEEIKSSSPDHHEHQESPVYIGNLYTERKNMVKDVFKHEQSGISERTTQGKSKRGSNGNDFDDNSENTKRFRAGNLTLSQVSGGRNSLFSESPHIMEGAYKGLTIQETSRTAKDGTGIVFQKGYDHAISGKCVSDHQQSGRISVDSSARAKAPAAVERTGKHAESLGPGVKYSERSLQNEGFPMQKDKVNRETKNEDGYNNERKAPKNSKIYGFGDRHMTPIDPHYMKHSELVGKFKEVGSVSNSHIGFPPMDSKGTDMDISPVINGRGSILQRELSDLELGELREPLPDGRTGVKKQLEKNSSSKRLDKKPTRSDHSNSDLSKARPAERTTADLRKPSPHHPIVGIPNPEGLSKKRIPEHHVEDFTRPHHRAVQPQPQHPSREDHAELGSQFNRLADVSSIDRHNQAGESQIGLEGNGGHKKVPVSAPQQHDTKQGLVPHSTKESKKKKINPMADLGDRRKDTSLLESNDGGQKRRESSLDEDSCLHSKYEKQSNGGCQKARESSLDEDSCFYSKYEKEEPELKGPIKDFSQYEEYVQEYREKYDSYCSLNKILDSYRIEFNKLGKDLDIAKGRDMERYYNILGQLKESYHQCGTGHKRLKKIFIVLHEELKHLKQMIKDYAVSYTKD